MASPIPPDPYAALGVSKDADIAAIRSAHRKLALKHHPDRIKDEAQRERGKDEFQRVQQAYEILSDPVRRARYDDRVRLAELRREAMLRDPPPSAAAATSRAYPMRPAAAPATTSYRADGHYFEEIRQPRNVSSYDYRDPYDDAPPRTATRKYSHDYETRAPAAKASDKTKKAASAAWMAGLAAAKLKAQAEKARATKADEKTRDKEKRRERVEKTRRAYVEEADSDSDYLEVRPRRTSPRTEKARDFDDDFVEPKWERHHEESRMYMAKAKNLAPAHLDRRPSDDYHFWHRNADARASPRKSGSDGDKRPASSKGPRRTPTDEYFVASFAKSTSSPANLRAHVEERAPPRSAGGGTRDHDRDRDRPRDRERDRDRDRERDRDRDRDRDHRPMVPPTLHRAHTAPMPKSSSAKAAAPSRRANLKHGDPHTHMHDSGYGSSSSPHTPEIREESPPRPAGRRVASSTSTKKYQIVPDSASDDDHGRSPRVNKIYDDDYDRFTSRHFHHSPESIVREPERRKDRPERPRVETASRSKSSRGASLMKDFVQISPTLRRAESARYEERVSPRSPRETPPISRADSGRKDLYREIVTPDERDAPRYNTRSYANDKIHFTPRREPSYSTYVRDSPEYRDRDAESRFRRRPSVSVGGY